MSAARALLPLLAAAGLAAACGDVPAVERDPSAPIQTSALRYELRTLDFGYAATIPWTFQNGTGHEVRVRNCRGDVRPSLQVRREGRWVDAWRPFGSACESPPLVIPPGGSYADTLEVVGAPPGSNVTPAFVFEDVAGVYRLVWDRAADLPLEETVSNAFVLEPS